MMTEEEWLTHLSPKPLLNFVCLKSTKNVVGASERKLRLFACGCIRRLSPLLHDHRLWEIVKNIENCTDVRTPNQLHKTYQERIAATEPPPDVTEESSWRACRDAVLALTMSNTKAMAWSVAEKAKVAAGCEAWFGVQLGRTPKMLAGEASDPKIKPLASALNGAWAIERKLQANLLRDIFGNPFRPATLDSSCLTPAVEQLAQAIYDDRAFDKLPMLADLLEESGCDQETILKHMRGGGDHVRGCFALDLVLGKS